MAFILNDRVKQTSTTVGTISMVVDGSLTGFVTFTAGIGDTNTTYYTIVGEDVASEWEVGIGTYTSSGTSLSRDTIINSSTGSKVDFSAGTKVVFCTMPGEKIAYKDSSGNAVNSVSYKQEGTNFTGSLLVGHATTGTLSTAIQNVGVGLAAMDAITSGDNNSGVGYNALTALTSGTHNTGIGRYALSTVETTSNNTAVGSNAMKSATGGINTAVGVNALTAVTGDYNTAIGKDAGTAVLGGDYNICVGYDGGDNITTGSGNIIIGTADAAAVDSARTCKIVSYDGSSTTNHFISDSSGNVTFAGTATAAGSLLATQGDATALAVALG